MYVFYSLSNSFGGLPLLFMPCILWLAEVELKVKQKHDCYGFGLNGWSSLSVQSSISFLQRESIHRSILMYVWSYHVRFLSPFSCEEWLIIHWLATFGWIQSVCTVCDKCDEHFIYVVIYITFITYYVIN